MYLLDTNVLINFFCAPQKLSSKVLRVLTTEKNIFVSIVSFWEIALKQSIGKLNISVSMTELASLCQQRSITIIGIKPEELEKIKSLKRIHNDPFDRLLIAQTVENRMTFITSDSKIKLYKIDVLEY